MHSPEALQASESVRVSTQIVHSLEPHLALSIIRTAIITAAPSPGKQKRLATELQFDPGVLTSGTPTSSSAVQSLIRILRRSGATKLMQPLCEGCQKARPLSLVGVVGRRLCTSCELSWI